MAILDPRSFECPSHDVRQTERLGARLGALLGPGAVVALAGELGAGKTHFARGVGMGWGADQELRSPTFTLVQQHRRPADGARLYHADLYRVTTQADIDSVGLGEILDDADSVVLIEWPERAPALVPERAIHVRLTILSETRRLLLFSARTAETWQFLLGYRKLIMGA